MTSIGDTSTASSYPASTGVHSATIPAILGGPKVAVQMSVQLQCPRRAHIITHERMHTGERPFICQLCQKSFVQDTHLRIHQRAVHGKEAPHECALCGQRFTQAANLARHRQCVHTREGPLFDCPQCGRGFTLEGNLTKHLLTHTGERPHACPTCGMRFARRSNMKKHVMVVHDRRYPHHCPHCGKGMATVHNLRQHLQANHDGEGEGAVGEKDE